MQENKYITIYTDASVCPNTESGGWAAWIKAAPGETHLASGIFKTPVKSSTDAELRAIANGLTVAKRVFDIAGKTIVVVTDSQESIDWITQKTTAKQRAKKTNRIYLDLSKWVINLVPAECKLTVKKVKAHSRSDGKRSFINNLVDKAAKRQMKKGRILKTKTENVND